VTNISGDWTGVYSYPRRLAPTAFDAELRDTNGLLSGLITELGDSARSRGHVLQSTVIGQVSGQSVRFTKIYDDPVRSHAVFYEGEVIEDGNAIEGQWAIGPNWSGPFRMQKRSASEMIAEEVGEEVPAT
jgi:hypothetical protein